MRNRKFMAVLLSVMLIVTMMPATASAKVKEVDPPTEVTSLISSTGLEHNFVNVTLDASQRTMTVTCETPIISDQFSFNVRKIGGSSSTWIGRVYPTQHDGYCSFTFSFPATGSKNWNGAAGEYVLMITKPTEVAGKSSDVVYKNCNFKVEGGKFSILQFDDIISENDRVQSKVKKSPSKYTKTNMSDIKSYVFKNPKTKKVASVTSAKVKYFKKVSDAVVKGAETDYEKLLKIYEYVAENFYYDDVAFDTGKNQYVDPYNNLYAMRNKNKKKVPNATKDGKVASTCVGYGAVVVALARAQGIPARILNGHHISMSHRGWNNWSTESDITKMDHWWAEAYVDDRWITIDPTPGNGNRYNSRTKTWEYTGITNYIYFDPTPEQLATSHVRFAYLGGTK